MRAVLLAAFFLPTLLFACSGDYALCKQKFNDALVAQQDGLRIPVNGSRYLIYATTPPSEQVISTNPFLGLYLATTTEPFAFPFTLDDSTTGKLIAVDGVMALPGKIVEKQNGLNRPGRFEHPLSDSALLIDACCNLEGIVTRKGVIDKAFIRHFLESEGRVVYGDAGFRLSDEGKEAVIESIDPFMPDNPFQKGDHIAAFDGTAVRSSSELMQRILFASPGTPHQVELKRAGKTVTVEVTLQERMGGGQLSDTYLERFGCYFDQEMYVIEGGDNANALGVRPGDRLIQVNVTRSDFDDEIRAAMGQQAEKVSLLFERDGFQFFIELPFQKK